MKVVPFSLQSLEDQVCDLLCQADETAEQHKDQSQIYDAMAATLNEAWDSLISVLEKRRDLLHVTSEFFNTAVQVLIFITVYNMYNINQHHLAPIILSHSAT